MITVSLDPGGFKRALDMFGAQLDRHMAAGLEATLEDIAARAKQTTKFVDRTGALRNSIQSDGVRGSVWTDEMVGTIGFGATSEAGLRKKRGGTRRRQVAGFPYGLSQEFGSSNGVKEKRFIRDAIDASLGEFLEGAMADAFRAAGFEVT